MERPRKGRTARVFHWPFDGIQVATRLDGKSFELTMERVGISARWPWIQLANRCSTGRHTYRSQSEMRSDASSDY